jgi:ribosome biogenesis GTPase
LSQQHPLAHLGWSGEHQQHHLPDDLVPARVLAVDRGRVLVDTGTSRWSAPLAGRLRNDRAMPVTGDFVGVVPDEGPVRHVLPRQGVIARKQGKRVQILAANVDLALLATSANRDLNPRRLARFLAVTARGGVESVIVLTKTDLVDELPEIDVDGAPVVPVSVLAGTGLDAVEALLEPRRTAVLLGTSGVGKSTLLNALLGFEKQPTQQIRESDARGRHTTVRRELVPLPSGALLIDTPGLRLVQPLTDDDPEPALVDKEAQKRARKAREREFHRSIYKDMRAIRRDREAREGR